VKHYLGPRHFEGRENSLLPIQLPVSGKQCCDILLRKAAAEPKALDDAETTQKAHSSFFGTEDRQSTITSERASRYRIQRRPVASPAQLEGPYSNLSIGIERNKVPADLPRFASASSMEEEQHHSVLEVVNFEHFVASEPKHEREPIISNPAIYTSCGEILGDSLLPEPHGGLHKEWIPFMLRKTVASLLAVILFMLVGLLEFLDRFEKKRYR